MCMCAHMLANVYVDAYTSGSIKELSIDFDPSGHATGFVRGSSGALVRTAVTKQLPTRLGRWASWVFFSGTEALLCSVL